MKKADELVGAYIKLRAMKKDMQATHKEELAPINEKMDLIEAGLLNTLNDTGVESMRTGVGTAYKVTKTKASVQDREIFFKYVFENGLQHMLSSAVSDPAVVAFIESTGEAPPGVGIATSVSVNIRK